VTLLDEVIEKHGGIDRWAQTQRFTVHASIDGAVLARKGKARTLKDVVLTGQTDEQHLCITGFTAPNKRAVYQPDRVAVETLDGVTLEERIDPRAAFQGHTDVTPWDDLHLAYVCGYASWCHLTTPFLFTRPGFRTEELGPWQEAGETWQRLRVVFPPDIVALAAEQVCYFDELGLLRRIDYDMIDAGGVRLAHYAQAHQSFSGIVLPTLRRAIRLGSDGNASAHPVWIDIEIFDAIFE
jgi:hypothetical protein